VRFEDRTRGYKDPVESDIQMVFYGLSLVPSYEAYDERTKNSIHAFIDLRGEDWYLKERLSEKLFGNPLEEQFRKWMEDFNSRSLPEVLTNLCPVDQGIRQTVHEVVIYWVNYMFNALQRRASMEPGKSAQGDFVQGDFGVELYGYDQGIRIVFIHNGKAFNPSLLKGLLTRDYWQGKDPAAMSDLLRLQVRGTVENKIPPLVGLFVEFENPDSRGRLTELVKEDETIEAGSRIQIDVLHERAHPIEGKDVPNSVNIFRQVVDFNAAKPLEMQGQRDGWLVIFGGGGAGTNRLAAQAAYEAQVMGINPGGVTCGITVFDAGGHSRKLQDRVFAASNRHIISVGIHHRF